MTRAFLAAASMSTLGSWPTSTEAPGTNWVVSRETSTPASTAALVTASRTATAASSSTASSSRSFSIPSPPPADVSRETSTPVRDVDASRTSTSPVPVRVAVEIRAWVLVSGLAGAARSIGAPEPGLPVVGACPPGSCESRAPGAASSSSVVRSTIGALSIVGLPVPSDPSEAIPASSVFDGWISDRSGSSRRAAASPSSAGTAVRPSAGSSPEVRAARGEGAGSCGDAWLLPDSPASPASSPSGLRGNRRGQDGSGRGVSSSSGETSSIGSRRSALSTDTPAGQAIGSAGSFHGTCSPFGSSDHPAASPGRSIRAGSAIPATDSDMPGGTSGGFPAPRSSPELSSGSWSTADISSTVAPGTAPGETADPRSWEIPETSAPGSWLDSERLPVSSESIWLARCSADPAGAGEPISGSGSTWTIPLSINSGPRCPSGTGVSPIPEWALPPTDSSGPARPPGSSLGRSALSRSESVSAYLLAPCSGENHPTSVPVRCGGRGSSPPDLSGAVDDAVRDDGSSDPPLDVPAPVERAPGGSSTAALPAPAASAARSPSCSPWSRSTCCSSAASIDPC